MPKSTAVRGRARGRPRGTTTGHRTTITTPVVASTATVFKCPACFLVFNTEVEMTDHQVTHSELCDFECGQCDKLFESMEQLKTHFSSAHMMIGDKDPVPSVTTNSTATPVQPAQTNVNTVHQSPVAETIMPNMYGYAQYAHPTSIGMPTLGLVGASNRPANGFPSAPIQNLHLHPEPPLPLPPEPQQTHVEPQSSQASEPTVDESCAYSDADNDMGDDNIGGFSPGRSEIDDTNSSVVSTKPETVVVESTELPKDPARPYLCGECGKSFGLHRTFRDHLKRHNAEFRYFCEVVGCGKGFVRKQERDRHEIRVHVPPEYRPSNHVCKECGNSYTQAAHLYEHMKKHTLDEPPYKCELCDKRFWQLSSLKTHMLSIKHGGTGVSYRNKPKPKRDGPRKKPGPKPKNLGLVKEDNEGPRLKNVRKPDKNKKSKGRKRKSAQEGSDDDYVPPDERNRLAQNSSSPTNSSASSVCVEYYPSMPKIDKMEHPQNQPQRLVRDMPTLTYQQNHVAQHQQTNPLLWRGSVAPQQFSTFGSHHQQSVGQQMLHIPPGGTITLQDAFQMGYGIPHTGGKL